MALQETFETNKLAHQELSYTKILSIILSRWYWIVGALTLALIAANIYIAYTPETYRSEAKVKLNLDEQNQGNLMLVPTAYRYARVNQIETEAQIMKSEVVVLNAIADLDYKVSYFLEGKIRKTEVYPFVPFKIEIIQQNEDDFTREEINVKAIDQSSFQLFNPTKNIWEKYNYNQIISVGGIVFRIISTVPSIGKYSFKFNSIKDFKNRVLGGLSVEEADKNTNIMKIMHVDKNPRFSAAILNALITQYIKNDEKEKKQSAKQTIDFLDDRLRFIDSTVNNSGDILSTFQQKNNFIDPESEKSLNVTKLPELKRQLEELRFNDFTISQLDKQINNAKLFARLTLNIEDQTNSAILDVINQYNQSISNREELLKVFQPTSERIVEVERKITQLRSGLVNIVATSKANNQQAIRLLENQIGATQKNLGAIPPIQNDFTKLANKSDIDLKMLSILFERKLQAQITQASVVSNAKVISFAEIPNNPIDPIPRKVYTSYLLLGLVAGLGLIILTRVMNPYIYDVETIEGLTSTPIIGVILKYPHKLEANYKKILSLSKPKSVFAESVRSVRTNLSFMGGRKTTKIICVTSEVSGEGKSFVTVNLAGTLAIIDKKVIIIAADLRRSKLHKTFDSDNSKGLSTYLSGMNTLEEIVQRDNENEVDFITSGPVPPNPAELLHNSKIKELLDTLSQKYEYILIDTAPVGLVSDSIPLIRYADINLFVIRSGKSSYKSATIPDRMTKEYELNNIAIVLNSFGNEKLHANVYSTNYATGNSGAYYYSDYSGYGNSGYYDNSSRNKWWNFWRKTK